MHWSRSFSVPHVVLVSNAYWIIFGRKERITLCSDISKKNNSHFAIFMKKARFTVHGYVTKSRFTRKNSHFTICEEKKPFTGHEKTLYHPLDVPAKISSRQIFLKLLMGSDNELLVPEIKKKWGSPTLFQR